MRTIIAGSRSFVNYDKLKESINNLGWDISLVVSGGASGSDLIGEKYAKMNNIPIEKFIPDWNTHGKKAGILRNIEMANNADACIVFWDGQSKGTKHMIDIAKKKGLKLEIIMI